jgi:hypothetical protein
MATRTIWVIEEREVDGQIANRESNCTYTESENGSWSWDCPTARLSSAEALAEWNRVMGLLSNVNGEDLRHIVCGVGLMDHCLNANQINNYN